ncbi:MAG: GntR family transcriptional regulator, partial [Mycobacterium sp.]
RGVVPTNAVLSVDLMEPTEDERAALGLTPSSTVVRLERLRRQDDNPMVYSVDVFDRAVIQAPIGEIDWAGSLFDIFGRFDRCPVNASATVSAVTLEAELASRLGVSDSEAWLRLQQVHSDARARPVLLSDDFHRGSEFTFDVPRQK